MSFPAGVATTTVTGAYLDAQGDPAIGYLHFVPTVSVKHPASNTVFTASGWDVELKGDGSFGIELPVCQTALVPNTFLYTVSEYFDNKLLRTWNIRLDESLGPQVSLVSLSPASPPTVLTVFPTLSDVASVAAGLDQNIYDALDLVDSHLSDIDTELTLTLTSSQVGVSVPPLILGKIPAQYIPAIPQGNYYQVSSQAAMLALAANRGDFALRTDTSQTFVLSQDDPTVLSHWLVLPSGGAVNSVNGKTGVVSLSYLDVNAAASTHTHNNLSMSSYSAVAGTVTTLGVVNFSGGGTSALRTTIDNTGLKNYDSGSQVWQQDLDSTRTSYWYGARLQSAPINKSQGGISFEPATYTLTGTVGRTVGVVRVADPIDAGFGVNQTVTVDWDSTVGNYTALTYQVDTQTIVADTFNKKSQYMQKPNSVAWTLTSSSNPSTSLVLANSAVAGGQLTVNATGGVVVPTGNVQLNTTGATTGLYYSQLLSAGGIQYERRDTIDTNGAASTVVLSAGIERSRLDLTPAGAVNLITPSGTNPLLINSDTGPITNATGFVASTGWSVSSVNYRVKNGFCSLYMAIFPASALSGGNIANTTVLDSTPVAIRPFNIAVLSAGGSGGLVSGGIFASGIVQIWALDAGTSYPALTNISLSATYMI